MLSADAIKKITELATPTVVQVDDRVYSTRDLHPVKPYRPEVLQLSTLQGLVDWLADVEDIHTGPGPWFIHVASPTVVFVRGTVDPATMDRHLLVTVNAKPIPLLDGWVSLEDAIIGLQSRAAATAARDDLVRFLGKVTGEEIRISEDDGVSQEVTIRAGVALRDRMAATNPVHLSPFRTFREVEQPSSPYILRLRTGRNGPEVALFQADGDKWELEAIQLVGTWLQNAGVSLPVVV